MADPTRTVSSATWEPGERERFLAEQVARRETAGTATGHQGAVTVAYGAYAARSGLEAMKQGGNAMDAALTTALAQVALTAGAPVSYFGIMSLVYLDAATGRVHTLNAEWNTVRGETDPASIPGFVSFGSDETLRGTEPSGRTALVGGFMKGVEAAHRRFGALPFASIFGPAIEVAEEGTPVNATLAWCYQLRRDDLARLPETARALLKPDGSGYALGETLRQPALAETLRRVAVEGADHMYGGEWGERLVESIRADGGHLTLDDLRDYEVIWADALHADIGDGWSIATSPAPNAGGVTLIEAQNVATVSGLADAPHWTGSSESMRRLLDISQMLKLMFVPQEVGEQIFPGLDLDPESRITRTHAEALWEQIKDGNPLGGWKRTQPMHSDDVVAIDADGNIAAITHSINSVLWGRTAINVGGISIGDPASFQQHQVAAREPGSRLPAPTETGILYRDGTPVLGFASMGAGLHQRTMQGLLNVRAHGMTVEEAVNTPDLFFPSLDPETGESIVAVPAGRFDPAVLDGTGFAWREFASEDSRFGGEGHWVAISRDPATGELSAASANRTNSAAVAY